MRELGLWAFYRNDPLLIRFLRKVLAVGYLPVFYVRWKYSEITRTLLQDFWNSNTLKSTFPWEVSKILSSTYFHLIFTMSLCARKLRTIIPYKGSNHQFSTPLGEGAKLIFWLFLKTLFEKKKNWRKQVMNTTGWDMRPLCSEKNGEIWMEKSKFWGIVSKQGISTLMNIGLISDVFAKTWFFAVVVKFFHDVQ